MSLPAKTLFAVWTVLISLLVVPMTYPQERRTTFYDNTGKVTHRWIQNGDQTTVVDSSNRTIGYRHNYDGRIEIQDNTRRIRGYEEDD
jgi:hypothetical protein